jgi:outer membrane protein
MSKFAFALLIILGLALTPLWSAQADFKVGVVDGMDVVTKSTAGKGVQENLRKKSTELSRPFEARRQDIARMMADFEKQASVMKEDARKRKEEEINKKVEEFRKQQADAEKQMAQFQEKELAPLFQKLEQAVKAVATENKLDLVLDKRNSGLLFIAPSLDITEKVRSKFGP